MHGSRLEFVVLFGSRARGCATDASDYDLLVGLQDEDRLRLVERLGLFQDELTGRCEVFPYTPQEIEELEASGNVLLLDALADGVVLYDRGAWHRLRERFEARRSAGELVRIRHGWEFKGE